MSPYAAPFHGTAAIRTHTASNAFSEAPIQTPSEFAQSSADTSVIDAVDDWHQRRLCEPPMAVPTPWNSSQGATDRMETTSHASPPLLLPHKRSYAAFFQSDPTVTQAPHPSPQPSVVWPRGRSAPSAESLSQANAPSDLNPTIETVPLTSKLGKAIVTDCYQTRGGANTSVNAKVTQIRRIVHPAQDAVCDAYLQNNPMTTTYRLYADTDLSNTILRNNYTVPPPPTQEPDLDKNWRRNSNSKLPGSRHTAVRSVRNGGYELYTHVAGALIQSSTALAERKKGDTFRVLIVCTHMNKQAGIGERAPMGYKYWGVRVPQMRVEYEVEMRMK